MEQMDRPVGSAMKRIIPRLPTEERVFWAKHTFSPKEVLVLLGEDPSEEVRAALARNPACPPETLIRLAQDGGQVVQEGVVSNPSVPPGLLEELYTTLKSRKGWPIHLFAGNPSTPVHILKKLARKDWYCMKGLAKNRNTPPDILLRILEKEPALAPELAGNPSLPTDILLELAGRYPENAANNPSLPEGYLRQLGKDPRWWVRAGVAQNPSAPRDVLEALAKDGYPRVRDAVCKNPTAPFELLAQMAKRTWGVWREAASNPSLSLEGFARLVIAEFQKVGWLGKTEALKLLPLLDLIPKGPLLWFAIWRALDEKGREIFMEHPDARGMLLLGRLGR